MYPDPAAGPSKKLDRFRLPPAGIVRLSVEAENVIEAVGGGACGLPIVAFPSFTYCQFPLLSGQVSVMLVITIGDALLLVIVKTPLAPPVNEIALQLVGGVVGGGDVEVGALVLVGAGVLVLVGVLVDPNTTGVRVKVLVGVSVSVAVSVGVCVKMLVGVGPVSMKLDIPGGQPIPNSWHTNETCS